MTDEKTKTKTKTETETVTRDCVDVSVHPLGSPPPVRIARAGTAADSGAGDCRLPQDQRLRIVSAGTGRRIQGLRLRLRLRPRP